MLKEFFMAIFMNRFAFFVASNKFIPKAILPEIAAESVHPVPCVLEVAYLLQK
jgi:hypothetical protein